jgi:methyl coenzyme M reductase subunit D
MTNEEIKIECEKMYLQIKEAEDRLAEIRKICKHENTFEGNYSWRPGAMFLAEICSDCKELVKYK